MLWCHCNPSMDSQYVGSILVHLATCNSQQRNQDRNHSLESTHRFASQSHSRPFPKMPLICSINSRLAFLVSLLWLSLHISGHVLLLHSHVSHPLYLVPIALLLSRSLILLISSWIQNRVYHRERSPLHSVIRQLLFKQANSLHLT